MISWAAPFTSGGKAVLKKGERIKTKGNPFDPQPIGAYAVAINYDELEARMVPKLDKNNAKYTGFYFSVKTLDLNTKFKLVESGAITKHGSKED